MPPTGTQATCSLGVTRAHTEVANLPAGVVAFDLQVARPGPEDEPGRLLAPAPGCYDPR